MSVQGRRRSVTFRWDYAVDWQDVAGWQVWIDQYAAVLDRAVNCPDCAPWRLIGPFWQHEMLQLRALGLYLFV